MKKLLLAYLIFSFTAINPLWAQTTIQTVQDDKPVLVRQIILSGFVLSNRQELDKIIKPYRKKYLSDQQIKQIIQDIKNVYLENGFAGLIAIDYKFFKNNLLIAISLDK